MFCNLISFIKFYIGEKVDFMTEGLGFYIGRLFVAYYGLMIIMGIVVATLVGWYQVKRYRKSMDDFVIIVATAGLFGIIGAKLLSLLQMIDEIDFSRLSELSYLNSVMSGGFVFYGGLIGGLLGFLFCSRVLRLPVADYVKIAIPCLPIVHGFGRIGCALVGCCYGRPYDGIGAIVYEQSHFAPNHHQLFPVQAMEAFLNLMIAAVLLVAINKFAVKRVLELYLIIYAVMRFILEFFRFDDVERGGWGPFSTSQYISIFIVIGVCMTVIIDRHKGRINPE
jgi:phosphatidylglycerol:prolipoprotein diacylglycerol transferase